MKIPTLLTFSLNVTLNTKLYFLSKNNRQLFEKLADFEYKFFLMYMYNLTQKLWFLPYPYSFLFC